MLGRISSATEDGIRVRTQFFDQIFIPFSGLPEGSELYVLLQPYCPLNSTFPISFSTRMFAPYLFLSLASSIFLSLHHLYSSHTLSIHHTLPSLSLSPSLSNLTSSQPPPRPTLRLARPDLRPVRATPRPLLRQPRDCPLPNRRRDMDRPIPSWTQGKGRRTRPHHR
jgi:RNA polymerase III subunit Rpc25